MNGSLQKTWQLNPVLLLILLTLVVTAFGVIIVYLAFVAPDLLGGLLATALLTLAMAIPIHQKRFSFLSILLIIATFSFLMGGLIQDAYNTVVRVLPVRSQIEFFKVMRPVQVCGGLSTLGLGLTYVVIYWVVLRSRKVSERVNAKRFRFYFWSMLVMGILITLIGINSIVGGLRKF